jgi:murein DD-endopeptidase MepM/ murein hydrolase activator NlpD
VQGTVRRSGVTLIVIAAAFGLLAAATAAASPTALAAARAFGASTLKLGSRGAAVRTLQQGLTTLGFPADADGQFGRGTRKRLKQWEKTNAATPGVVRNGKLSIAEAKLFTAQVTANKGAGAAVPNDISVPHAQPSPGPGAGSLGMPLPSGWILTSTFWEQRSYERHPGVDLAISEGTPILASGAGTVTTAAPSGGYGNYICVSHSSTLSTCYAHASEMLVSAGDTVQRGQTIARVGCTGNCTGPHLHFEVRVKGAVVCPAPWVGQSSSTWCEPDSPGYGTTAISAAVVARSASTYTLLGSGDGEICNLRAKRLRGAGRVVSAKS